MEEDLFGLALGVDLDLGGERGDRIENDHPDLSALDECFDRAEGLFGAAGFDDQEVVESDPQDACVAKIETVFGVDVNSQSTGLLAGLDRVEGQGRFADAGIAKDLDHAAFWIAAHTEGLIESPRTARPDGRKGGFGGGLEQALPKLLFKAHKKAFEGIPFAC